MKRLLLFTVACSLYWITPAQAQVCGGGASFTKGPYQVGASVTAASSAKLIAFGGGAGGDIWWGQAGVEVTSFDKVDGHAKGFYINVGGDYVVDKDKKVYACPIISLARSGGLDVPGVDSHATLFTVGGSVGYLATKIDTTSVIPTAGLFIQHQSNSASSTVAGVTGSLDTSDNFGSLKLGVGFVFNETIAIVPAVILPFGLEGGENSFFVGATINFGK